MYPEISFNSFNLLSETYYRLSKKNVLINEINLVFEIYYFINLFFSKCDKILITNKKILNFKNF